MPLDPTAWVMHTNMQRGKAIIEFVYVTKLPYDWLALEGFY